MASWVEITHSYWCANHLTSPSVYPGTSVRSALLSVTKQSCGASMRSKGTLWWWVTGSVSLPSGSLVTRGHHQASILHFIIYHFIYFTWMKHSRLLKISSPVVVEDNYTCTFIQLWRKQTRFAPRTISLETDARLLRQDPVPIHASSVKWTLDIRSRHTR